MKRYHTGNQARGRAFTLIEIMVVLAVIAVIATMAVPAMNSVLKGSKMTQSTDGFERDIARARSAAQRENQPIEFRFYEYRDPEQPNSQLAYRAYQAVKRVYAYDDHTQTEKIVPIFDVKLLPPGIIFSGNAEYSTILESAGLLEDVAKDQGDYDDSIPRVEEANYKAFYFRPDGSTNLVGINQSKKWCVTIVKESQGDVLPPDFVTFQVDAYNGQARRYEKGF